MYQHKHLRKNGRPGRISGVRLSHRKRFDPSLPAGTGMKVRSRYEKICVEYFESSGISFQYEPLLLLDGHQYRPDFFLNEYNLFIEICGFGHMPYYNDRVEHKRRLYAKHNLKALFIPYNGRGSLKGILKRELENAGIALEGGVNKLRLSA
jgi:hypothetical protein